MLPRTMTRELQQAMARYEEARIRYRQAVLASLRGGPGASSGDVIKEAIRALQVARAEVARLGPPPPPPAAPEPPESLPRRLVRMLLAS